MRTPLLQVLPGFCTNCSGRLTARLLKNRKKPTKLYPRNFALCNQCVMDALAMMRQLRYKTSDTDYSHSHPGHVARLDIHARNAELHTGALQ